MTALPLPPADPLAAALRYASIGLRVVPIQPGAKRPTLNAWQDAATTDRATIESWWTGLYKGHGVGLALGELDDLSIRPTYIFAVDIDMHGVDGEQMFRDLEAEHGTAPETVEAITGGGGRHLLFSSPTEIRNGVLTDGVDIRGAGGQIVVEPTVHPSGQQYAWVDGQAPWECDIAPAPQWLLDRLTVREVAPRATIVATDVGDRPGDLWAAQTTWEQLLTKDGWTLSHRTRDGELHWVRPGKEVREGTSATTGYTANDNLNVFTSSMTHVGLQPNQTYSKLGYLAATRFGGDHAAAASALAREGHRKDPLEGWVDVVGTGPLPTPEAVAAAVPDEDSHDLWEIATRDTLTEILDGDYEPLRPDMFRRSDGAFLLYRGKVHSIAAEPGAGKSMVAMWAVAEELIGGHRCAWIDWEDNVATAVGRLRAMGVPPETITDRFIHVKPIAAIRGGGVPTAVIEATRDAALVVIDSTGEALAHSGLNQNNDDEVGAWMNNTARVLARGGATVLMIDHMVKSKDDQGRFAIGSQRKLAAVDGIAYTVTVLASPALDKVGRLLLKVSKDRHGNYAQGETAAQVTVTPGPDSAILVAVEATDSGTSKVEKQLTHLMEKVSRLLEDEPAGRSSKIIEASIQSRAAHVRTAIRQLVEAGFAERQGDGRYTVYVSTGAYREPSDLDDLVTEARSEDGETTRGESPRPPRPTSSPPRPGRGPAATSSPSSPSSPPYGGTGTRDEVRESTTDDTDPAYSSQSGQDDERSWI